MAAIENRSAVVPAVIVGLCLVVGLAIGGYFVGKGATRFRSDVRIVTVKGLVEREVKADQAVWTLGLVILDGEREGAANPRYVVSKFNDLRPQLLADATKNARATAQQFAADSGAQVGVIRSANQGSIQIFGMDGNDESGPFSPTSTPMKRIRVVSTFEFELR
jgi:uncharacterized protein